MREYTATAAVAAAAGITSSSVRPHGIGRLDREGTYSRYYVTGSSESYSSFGIDGGQDASLFGNLFGMCGRGSALRRHQVIAFSGSYGGSDSRSYNRPLRQPSAKMDHP